MQSYQTDFLNCALDRNALKFGEFTLKSGRLSPYFFNAGGLCSGADFATLGRAYAGALVSQNIGFDMLFGPAYKGIPLAAVTAYALATEHQKDIPIAFNRKEAKTHGEGGNIVGSPLKGRVMVVDDVITAGTAIRESIEIIEKAGAELAGVVVALDREERGKGAKSAIQEISETYNVPVIAIATLTDLLAFVSDHPTLKTHFSAIENYKAEYGV